MKTVLALPLHMKSILFFLPFPFCSIIGSLKDEDKQGWGEIVDDGDPDLFHV